MRHRTTHAFTLIELLVVITIIVVLLAMLTPALNKAVYQTELVTCAARQKGAATGALTYAFENKRFYPHRQGPLAGNWLPMYLRSFEIDDRPVIFSAIRPELLLDPFSGGIDITTGGQHVGGQYLQQIIYANYCMWFSWRHKPNGNNGNDRDREKGMYKIGQKFTWTNVPSDSETPPVQRSFNLLIGDQDVIRDSSSHGSHPDRDQQTYEWAIAQDSVEAATFYANQGRTLTISYWRNQREQDRGLYDTSYTYDDGSVLRFNDVVINDERMVYIPEAVTTASDVGWGRQVPR